MTTTVSESGDFTTKYDWTDKEVSELVNKLLNKHFKVYNRLADV